MTRKTTYLERLSDAFTLLCAGNRPSDKIIEEFFNEELDSYELQEFCIRYCPLPWSQGIVVIDAAITLAESPEEGRGHE